MTITKEKPQTTTLDAIRLSKGWRSVAAASGKDSAFPAFYHTICVEQYPEGLRLIASDSRRLLVSFVSADATKEEPPLEELPNLIAVAIDVWGRAKSLLAHMQQQATQDENEGLEAAVTLGAPWRKTNRSELSFDGFSALALDIEYVGHERLQLPVYDGPWPDWRSILQAHRHEETATLLVNQETLAALATATKPFGEFCEIAMTFAGSNPAVGVTFGDTPRVRGLLMPLKPDGDES